jgi:MFS transporter, DHA2 family, multidrug resistance protein
LVTLYSGALRDRLQQSASYLTFQGSDPYSANLRAIRAAGHAVQRQAFLLAYSDCFLKLGSVLLSSGTVLCFMKKDKTLRASRRILIWAIDSFQVS